MNRISDESFRKCAEKYSTFSPYRITCPTFQCCPDRLIQIPEFRRKIVRTMCSTASPMVFLKDSPAANEFLSLYSLALQVVLYEGTEKIYVRKRLILKQIKSVESIGSSYTVSTTPFEFEFFILARSLRST